MKKLLFITVIPLLLMHCFSPSFRSPNSHSTDNSITEIHTTTGQELIDLEEALDSEVITQEEYDELKLKIIERLDVPVDSTATE